jgi:hypothetical protein
LAPSSGDLASDLGRLMFLLAGQGGCDSIVS